MMLEEVMKNLAQRVNNDDVVALMYEYFGKIWDLLSDTMKNALINTLNLVKEIKIEDYNSYKDGVLVVGGCDKNVFIACNILLSQGHLNVGSCIQEEFTQLAYTRLISILVAEEFCENSGTVKEHRDNHLVYNYSWDSKYDYLEDYIKRLVRLYKKTCKITVKESFMSEKFFQEYFEKLNEEEKRVLLLFLVRIFKFIKTYNEGKVNYRSQRDYYYAWGDLQEMEKLRKIKPSDFLTVEKKLD